MELSADSAHPVDGRSAGGGTLLLEHAYEVGARLASNALYTVFEGRQRTFDRPVRIRFYQLGGAGLSETTSERLTGVIEAGGDGDWAVDVGELESGAPFLVVRPPEGQPAGEWWSDAPPSPDRLIDLIRALLEAHDGLTGAQGRQLGLESLHVVTRADGSLDVAPYVLGDGLTRAEVRAMTGLADRPTVIGFPPECFLPPLSEDEDVESTHAADSYRVAAIVYELVAGQHPYLPEGSDVSEAVARLGMGTRPQPAETGLARLDNWLAAALSFEPDKRPSLAELRALLEAAPVQPQVSADPPSLPVSTVTATPLPAPFRWAVRFLVLLTAVVATYLVTNRPAEETAVVITSQPSGVHFQRIGDDGDVESLGRTPILIENEPIGASIAIRPIYEDGQIGTVRTLSPDRLQVIEACRALHIRFDEHE